MRGKLLLLIVYVLGGASAALAPAATPERVRLVDVSTGLDADGVLLGDFVRDGRYMITAFSPADQVPFDTPVKPATLPDDDFPIPPWIANSDWRISSFSRP